MSSRSTGLCNVTSASNASASLSLCSEADTTTNGMDATVGDCCWRRRKVQPSITGIVKSQKITVGRSRSKIERASVPSDAVTTACPASLRILAVVSRVDSSSSITRITCSLTALSCEWPVVPARRDRSPVLLDARCASYNHSRRSRTSSFRPCRRRAPSRPNGTLDRSARRFVESTMTI
jgi:hypothetical protein